MSKYDQLDYKTLSEEKNNGLPKCLKNNAIEEYTIPDDLIGTPIQNFKNLFNIRGQEENSKFDFANNNQTLINENYFRNGKFFNKNMTPDEKREYVLDYMSFNFGNKVDGKYFELYLQEMFNLKKYELIDEDFDLMIREYFKKDVVNLDDPEDRKLFKKIMFHQDIKFMNKEEAKAWLQQSQMIDEESQSNESKK